MYIQDMSINDLNKVITKLELQLKKLEIKSKELVKENKKLKSLYLDASIKKDMYYDNLLELHREKKLDIKA
jgi:uncharacterized coiled-coil protein SlyX